MATAKDFVEFWLETSVHADEEFGVRRGRLEIQQLVDNLMRAAEAQGFKQQQIETELGGDVFEYIRGCVERKNQAEDARLRNEK